MDPERAELADANRRRKILVITTLFIGILLVFTLFSNTLLTITLPKVRTEQPQRGQLVQIIEGSGRLQPKVEADLLNEAGWKLAKMHVKEGDSVKSGQILATFDTKESHRNIQDEQARLAQMKLSMERLQDRYIGAYHNGDEMELREARREIESYKLEIGIQERKLQRMQEQLDNNSELIAPFDGIVTKVNASEGQSLGPARSVIQLTSTSEGFRFSFQIASELAALLDVREQLQVKVKGSEVILAEGRVAAMNDLDTGSAKQIVIDVQDAGFKGGEQASIRLSKSSLNEALLVSTEAIHQDRSGMYIYVIDEKKGPLGNAFYVRKSYIQTDQSNERETAVAGGLYLYEQVIVESGEPLQEGDRVRLE